MDRELAERFAEQLKGRQDLVREYLTAAIERGAVPGPRRWQARSKDDPGFVPLLPAGMHRLTRAEVHRLAVASFPVRGSRPALWASFERFRAQLAKLRVASEIWIAGSFLSSKPDPGDIDLVAVLNMERIVSLAEDDAVQLDDALDDAKLRQLDVAVVFDGDLALRCYLQGLLGFCEDRARAKGIAVVPISAE